ncbi:hypothetical protein CLV28_0072 [Sediminihabitans luteus]|uniref:Uncharacterized protein n=1 Tax=Sediminihabitans luteus TaxID=1138585 RepID=A0A2M9CY56_9CELL|nr:hypothetical protein [Sediminihabitans luteus]PJJ76864.1 hypothetical protein CLV28_0072 [Sediminihabitans luteus]GIJ00344.1 hypothetical protein Slu03_27210 [Sediminihabitans luteus]
MSGVVPAPAPPGRLGEAPSVLAIETFLQGLRAWCADRRATLDRLDAAVGTADDPSAHTSDVLLALTLWRAVQDRAVELDRTWAAGGTDVPARETVTGLVWGRLGSGDGSALVSLVEAVRLCDALVTSLSARLAGTLDASEAATRLRAVGAALARCARLGDDAAVTALRARLDRVVADAARGADVTGPLGEIERDVARTERDLIVGASRRHALGTDQASAAARAAALEAREPVLRELAERTRVEVLDPPPHAVPDVSRLGPVPDERAALDAYMSRLDAVERAMEVVEDVYTAPLRERARLRFRIGQLLERAVETGRAGSPTTIAGHAEALAAVERTPCDLAVARHLTDQLEVVVRPLPTTTPHRTAHAAGQEGLTA